MAAVVAAVVVSLAPQAAPEDTDRPGVETDVPTELADGSSPPGAPAELRDLVDRPLVVAARADELPDGMRCEVGLEWEDGPDVEAVFVTPTALHASLVGDGRLHGPAERNDDVEIMRATCLGRRQGGDWADAGGSVSSAQEPGPVGSSLGSGSSCCQDGYGTARADISVVGEVAWVLQDRGPYWLAYRADGLDVLTIEWPYPQTARGLDGAPPTRVRLVDADGGVVAEHQVSH